MSAVLVNGLPPADAAHALAASDRGLHYGDGVFETLLLVRGKARFFDDHWQRLRLGCERLGIAAPDRSLLMREIEAVTASAEGGVLKIIVTRGPGERGYRPAEESRPTRLVALHAPPPRSVEHVVLRWCETRLARNAQLAGIKHLNRLEQVLAQAEWRDPGIHEGLMLDTEGELVCATASNLFIVRAGVVTTPDLRFSGVRGVMRSQVLRAAQALGMPVSEEPLWPRDLAAASEVFITSAVRGIRPVVQLEEQRWPAGAAAQRLAGMLEP